MFLVNIEKMRKSDRKEIICRCNNISRKTIEDAIEGGCKTLNEIFDSTTAGVGPCGGSCRRKIAPMLENFLAQGQFAETAKSSSNDSCSTSEGSKESLAQESSEALYKKPDKKSKA